MADLNQKISDINRQKEEEITAKYAKKLGWQYVDLFGYPFSSEIYNLFESKTLLDYRFVPYLKLGSELKVGVIDTDSSEQMSFFQDYANKNKVKITRVLISKSSLAYALETFMITEKNKKEKVVAVSKKRQDFISGINKISDVVEAAKKVTTTELLDLILTAAAKMGASDVHIEPNENEFLIRYRIDGVLQDVMTMPLRNYHFLLSRIKFLAKLKMDNSKAPQDGRFSIKFEDTEIDLRVSTLPSAYGESIVLRLLGQEKTITKLTDLGFRTDALEIIKQAIAKPHGMILNTGPTGSGKSTTLYAILTELKKPGIKIISLEDPIEYSIVGVEQSQVDPESGYTFADGLRGALRQDPDILMVGEIRDKETAEIAVQAAMTGHLLLSTLHANTAPATFSRLLDIGVRPFLLAGSINLVMGQRLVRKLCEKCSEEYNPPEALWIEIQNSLKPIKDRLEPEIQKLIMLNADQVKIRKPVGCPICNNTGYLGRQVLVEVLVPSTNIEALIGKQATISDFTKTALFEGIINMEQDGLIKVLEGVTTTTEVWRVTKD